MDVQQINPVPAQPRQAARELIQNIGPARPAEIGDLGRNMQVIPAFGKPAQQSFSHAVGIAASRVKIGDPGGKAGVKQRLRRSGVRFAAPLHGAECEGGFHASKVTCGDEEVNGAHVTAPAVTASVRVKDD